MKKAFIDLYNSFSTSTIGFSARKLTAFVVVVVAMFSQCKWVISCVHNNDFALLPEILLIDFSFILSLFGLTTWQGIKDKQTQPLEQQPT